MVTMSFDASDPGQLQTVLARYVVVSRGHDGCRNIDLAMSSTTPDRFVIIQKWESPEAQRAHFDSADMVAMATACDGPPGGTSRASTCSIRSAPTTWHDHLEDAMSPPRRTTTT